MPRTRVVLLEFLVVFTLAAVLIGPKFRLKYMENWGSIDATFISDGRMLAENWPHPQWQPLWYGGTRFDFVYPPGLRYATAGLTKLLPIIPARAYHLYTAIMFAFGIAGIFLLVRLGSNCRIAGLLAAFAVASVSPAFLFLKHIRADSYKVFPQRLSALVRYGEGPHMSSLAILGPTLIASFFALKGGNPVAFALAALGAAWAVSNNFYGATALAIFFPILCWAVFVGRKDWMVWLRGAGIGLLAYGLSAVWLTPSFLSITAKNLHYVAKPMTRGSLPLLIACLIAFGVASWWWAKGEDSKTYSVFVGGSVVIFSLNVLGNYYWDFRVSGEPERMIPELDMVLILGFVELIRRLWSAAPNRWLKPVLTAATVAATIYFGRHFLKHPWQYYVRADYTQRHEYEISKWVHENIPGQKCMVTGTVRFWWNAWYSEAQVGGGSEQGLQNPNNMVMQWETQMGNNPERDLLWYKAFATDCIIVHLPGSKQPYIDFGFPNKYDGKLPVLKEFTPFDRIYKVPRRYQSLARVVDRDQLSKVTPVPQEANIEGLTLYTNMLEQGPDRPTKTRWLTWEHLRIDTTAGQNESVLAMMTYDPAWHAYSRGTELKVREDPLGQTVIETTPGEQTIDLKFEKPLENKVGGYVTVASLGLSGLLLLAPFRRKQI